MDPASIAIGVLGTVLELYKVSMQAYDLYLSIQEFNPAFGKLRLALDIERKRLELWAQRMGLDVELGFNERLRNDSGLLEIIQSILTEMKSTFEDSAKMLDDYAEATSSAPTEKPELSRRISPGTRKVWDNAGRYLKWATRDKKKLEQLVKSLKKYNDSLSHLATNVDQFSMHRSLRTQFIATNDIDQLQLLQETADMIGHEDLRHLASTKCFVQEVYRSEDFCATFGAARIQAGVKESSVEVTNSSHKWNLDFNRLRYEGVAIMANHTRTVGTYSHEDGEIETVVVDWSRCTDDSWRRQNPGAFQTRVANLAKILNRDLLPKGFRVLRCIGYLYSSTTTIGYLFRPPSDAISNKEPISLYDILKEVKGPSSIPALGDRFELAKAIVTTVFEFHNIGWMHKNIHPKNILFWPSKECDGEVNIRQPYIVGFDLSRSNQPGEASEKPIGAEEDDLYRHPSYKGADAGGFKPSYDFYSLGIILFEIAMWRLVSHTQSPRTSSSAAARERRKSSIADPSFIEKTIVGLAQDLGRYVGVNYRDAVLACIQLEFDDVWDKARENDRALLLQKAIQPKVVDAIDFCQA